MEIKKGDIVSVNFNNVQMTLCEKARVLNIPHTTGDSWIFFDLKTEKTYYVSEGCTVTLIKE